MKTVCVYCGSRSGAQPVYVESAQALAQALVAQDLGLVYGGGKVGLMGVVADEVMRLGGQVIGIIPEDLLRREVGHGKLTELHVVDSMHTRKQMMVDRADAFIALPGGIGTFEELFETFTWLQLGYHDKPIGLLNVAGYYDHLLKMLAHTVAENFLSIDTANLLSVAQQPAALIAALQARARQSHTGPVQHALI